MLHEWVFSLTSGLFAMVRIQVSDVKYGSTPSEKYMDVQWLDRDCCGFFPGSKLWSVAWGLRSRVSWHVYHRRAVLWNTRWWSNGRYVGPSLPTVWIRSPKFKSIIVKFCCNTPTVCPNHCLGFAKIGPDCQDTRMYIFYFGTIYINGDLEKTASA